MNWNMGYQDRDYFREEHTPYLDLIRSTRVCWGIVIVIAVLYFACLFTDDSAQPLRNYLQLDPSAMVQQWQWHRLVTAIVVADQPWHLLFALFILWLVGHELEQLVGGMEFGMEFLAFFLVACILSNLTLTLMYYYVGPEHAQFPFVPQVASFGPAGGALAVLAWAVMLGPLRVAHYFMIPMPMWIFGGLVLVLELFFFLQTQPAKIRLAVHGASLLFGLAYGWFQWRLLGWPRAHRQVRSPARRQLTAVLQSPSRRQLREEPKVPERDEPLTRGRAVDEQLEAKLDAVLEKVSQSGMDSLTEEEKNILKRASEVMKRRKL
jgi:membrane associated rhomboid family serine protease